MKRLLKMDLVKQDLLEKFNKNDYIGYNREIIKHTGGAKNRGPAAGYVLKMYPYSKELLSIECYLKELLKENYTYLGFSGSRFSGTYYFRNEVFGLDIVIKKNSIHIYD